MAQSINTKVDLVISGTSYHGLNSYGKIMIGDKGFEFYNDRNVNDYIQIPWKEVDYVIASVMFKGKHIPRYAIPRQKKTELILLPQKSRRKYCVRSAGMLHLTIWSAL